MFPQTKLANDENTNKHTYFRKLVRIPTESPRKGESTAVKGRRCRKNGGFEGVERESEKMA